MTDEIRGWVLSTDGDMFSQDVDRGIDLSTRDDRNTRSKVLSSLVEEGLVVRDGGFFQGGVAVDITPAVI